MAPCCRRAALMMLPQQQSIVTCDCNGIHNQGVMLFKTHVLATHVRSLLESSTDKQSCNAGAGMYWLGLTCCCVSGMITVFSTGSTSSGDSSQAFRLYAHPASSSSPASSVQ